MEEEERGLVVELPDGKLFKLKHPNGRVVEMPNGNIVEMLDGQIVEVLIFPNSSTFNKPESFVRLVVLPTRSAARFLHLLSLRKCIEYCYVVSKSVFFPGR